MEANRFNQAAMYTGILADKLLEIPLAVKKNATEIRLRCGRNISVEYADERYTIPNYKVTPDDITECIKRFCDYSIHSHEQEIAEGFITLKGGHRAGFSGTAVSDCGKIHTIRDYTSVNIRIAAEHIGCSDEIIKRCNLKNISEFKGLLLLGPPLSGKTTILRDLCRQLGKSSKLSLIDERNEIAAVSCGIPQNDVGENTDIFSGYTKYNGINMALRVMSPEIIVCDEIGQDYTVLPACVNSGVKMILTAHCGSEKEMISSYVIGNIIRTGAISHIVLLERKIPSIKGLWIIERKTKYDTRNGVDNTDGRCGWYLRSISDNEGEAENKASFVCNSIS